MTIKTMAQVLHLETKTVRRIKKAIKGGNNGH